jgi:transposase
MQMLAIDLGKRSFHVHGISAAGEVVSRGVGRAKLAALVERLDPDMIAMEACATAHHWARTFIEADREVRLINPCFVKPFVRGSKNDAVDAEAIFDAASRPGMRFVPVKTVEQQDLQSLHRVRDRLVAQRTSLINHTRGLLAEYGLVFPTGAALFGRRARAELTGAPLSPMSRETFGALLDELEALEARIEQLECRLRSICCENEACRRLMTIPGVGPVVATALVASISDARQFRSGRELAAWIGLVPRQHTTGGKPRLGGVGRRANLADAADGRLDAGLGEPLGVLDRDILDTAVAVVDQVVAVERGRRSCRACSRASSTKPAWPCATPASRRSGGRRRR